MDYNVTARVDTIEVEIPRKMIRIIDPDGWGTRYVSIWLKDLGSILNGIGGATNTTEYLRFKLRDGAPAWVMWDQVRELYRYFLGTFDWATPHGAKKDPMNWIMYYGGRAKQFGRIVSRDVVDRYITRRLAKMVADAAFVEGGQTLTLA